LSRLVGRSTGTESTAKNNFLITDQVFLERREENVSAQLSARKRRVSNYWEGAVFATSAFDVGDCERAAFAGLLVLALGCEINNWRQDGDGTGEDRGGTSEKHKQDLFGGHVWDRRRLFLRMCWHCWISVDCDEDGER
jgi:hypothetical protein